MIRKSGRSETHRMPREVMGEKPSSPHTAAHRFTCRGVRAYTHTHTRVRAHHSASLQTPLTPAMWLGGPIVRPNQGTGLDQTRLLHAVVTAPPHAPTPQGQRKAAATPRAGGNVQGQAEAGWRQRRRGGRGRGAAAQTDCTSGARRPPGCPVGFALENVKLRSSGPRGGGVPPIPNGRSTSRLARTASWREEAGGSTGFG